MLKIAQPLIAIGVFIFAINISSYAGSYSKSNMKDFESLDYSQNKEAIFEIPFEADINRILEWCLNKKVQVGNTIKDDIEDEINRRKETLENSKSKLDSYGTTTLYQEKIDELAELLKNPSIDYMGEKYILNNLSYQSDARRCFDIDISRDLVVLILSPTRESVDLAKYGVTNLAIYFFKDPEKGWVSYAVGAYFSRKAAYLGEESDPVNFVVDTLNKKYGQYIGFPYASPKIVDLIFTLTSNTTSLQASSWTGSDMLTAFLVWRKNIMRIPTADRASNNEMYILYFDKDIAQKIIEKKKENEMKCKQREQNSSEQIEKSGMKDF